jgi:Domain of unknown function (DUF4157)
MLAMAAPQQVTADRTHQATASTFRGFAARSGPSGAARRLRPSQVPVVPRSVQATGGEVANPRAASAPIAISQTGDASEREAEATADLISRGGAASLPEPLLRRAGNSRPAPMSGAGLMRGTGEALDYGVRRTMESRLGFDLGDVRVHRGDAAATATTALNARAFTVGRDIAFAPGEFRPGTASGQRLLAHELTHVAQQAHTGGPLVQRQPKPDTEPWLTQIKDILPPRKVGLIRDIYRIEQLTRRFTTDQLNELIGLIHADPEATSFTHDEAGLSGILVLQNTRVGKHLHVIAARLLLEQINVILPRNDGRLTDIDRVGQLTDRFTKDQLNELLLLIRANRDATTFTHDEAGVPGIFALQDTRIGNRLDVRAARLLLARFPEHPPTPRKSDEKKADVFSEETVRDAYIRFHYNAILHGKEESGPIPADLPKEIRQDCIAIVHALAPKLFTSESVVKRVEKRFKKLEEKPETYTIVHTGEALADIGVADPGIKIQFKDAAGRKTDGNTEPTTLDGSPWDKVMDKVGNDYGWHIFAMGIMDGHHSVTLFVDNQPDGKALFWADQWRIDPTDKFFELPGAVSGFRQYEKAGFEQFIAQKTNEWWKDVHRPDSDCGKRSGKKWDSVCRYNATVTLWQLRKVVQR